MGFVIGDLTNDVCTADKTMGVGEVSCFLDKTTDPLNPVLILTYQCPAGTTAMQTACIPLNTDAWLLAFTQDGSTAECQVRVPPATTLATATITAICTDLTLNIASASAARARVDGKVVRFQEGWPDPPTPPYGPRAWRKWMAKVVAAKVGAGGEDRKGPAEEEEEVAKAAVKEEKKKEKKAGVEKKEEVENKAEAADEVALAPVVVEAPLAPTTAISRPAPDPLAGARLAGPRAMVVTSSESMRP